MKTTASESPAIAIDPVTIQNMDIRTAMVTRGPLRRAIRTVGGGLRRNRAGGRDHQIQGLD